MLFVIKAYPRSDIELTRNIETRSSCKHTRNRTGNWQLYRATITSYWDDSKRVIRFKERNKKRALKKAKRIARSSRPISRVIGLY